MLNTTNTVLREILQPVLMRFLEWIDTFKQRARLSVDREAKLLR